MQRDFKLALALTILLVGAVGAFFFRHETDLNAGLPRLQDPARLEEELSGRSYLPYLSPYAAHSAIASLDGTASFEATTGRDVANDRDTDAAAPMVVQEQAWEDSAVASARVTPGALPAGRLRRIGESELVLPAIPLGPSAKAAAEGAAAKPAPPLPAAKATIDPPAPPAAIIKPDGRRVHIVQSGDTLTGVAKHYLGSITRYDEIFELNRDRLTGPHDLRVGMELILPPATSTAATNTPPPATPPVSTPPVSNPAVPNPAVPIPPADELRALSETEQPGGEAASPPEKKLFVPGRPPFVPGRWRPK